MNRRLAWVFSVAVGISTANQSSALNILQNAGFESGDTSGWTVGGNSPQSGVAADGTAILSPLFVDPFGPFAQNVRSGSYAGHAVVRLIPTERIVLSQTIAVTPGAEYSVGFFLGIDSSFESFTSVIGDGFTQIYIDGVGILADDNLTIFTGSSAADFVALSGSFNSALRSEVTVSFAILASGSVYAGVSFDDFRVELLNGAVPTPDSSSGAGLLVLGVAGLFFARRRLAGV